MSTVATHWEQVIKRRLVELAMTKGFEDSLAKMVAHQDIGILKSLLEATRMEAWQEGHDTALASGQTTNPYFKTKGTE